MQHVEKMNRLGFRGLGLRNLGIYTLPKSKGALLCKPSALTIHPLGLKARLLGGGGAMSRFKAQTVQEESAQ